MTELRLPLDRARDMPKRARVFMADALAGLPADLYGNVMLLTSELVTNVVVHGDLPAALTAVVDTDTVRVVVHDSGPGEPATPPPSPEGLPSNGRGLVIVAALARRWGVEPLGAGLGKNVWFDMELADARQSHPAGAAR